MVETSGRDPDPGGISDPSTRAVVERAREMIERTKDVLDSSRDLLDRLRRRDGAEAPPGSAEGAPPGSPHAGG